MAFAISSFAPRNSVYQTVLNASRTFTEATARRRAFLQTKRELQALSDASLADLGLVRSEIDRVALDATIGSAS